MRKFLSLAAVSFIALILAYEVNKAQVSSKHDEPGRFMIGILRGDGTIVPFAQYGNGGWWNPWPKPRESAESIYSETTEVMHHSLAGLLEPWFKQCGQIPSTWYFWSNANSATVLRASKVVQVEAHSGTNWALLTDYPSKPSEDPLHNYPGVVLSANQKIEPLIEIKATSPEWENINSFIKQIFDESETAEIDRIRSEKPPANAIFSSSKEERSKVKMSITRLDRSNSVVNGEHIYYFEAEKPYQNPASRDPGCNDVSLFRGWISADAKGGLGLMASQLMFTDCDRKGPSSSRPLGIMKLKDKTYLFVSEHGWEDESFTILELDNSGLHRVLETLGG